VPKAPSRERQCESNGAAPFVEIQPPPYPLHSPTRLPILAFIDLPLPYAATSSHISSPNSLTSLMSKYYGGNPPPRNGDKDEDGAVPVQCRAQSHMRSAILMPVPSPSRINACIGISCNSSTLGRATIAANRLSDSRSSFRDSHQEVHQLISPQA